MNWRNNSGKLNKIMVHIEKELTNVLDIKEGSRDKN